jgi:hypothetical protein
MATCPFHLDLDVNYEASETPVTLMMGVSAVALAVHISTPIS